MEGKVSTNVTVALINAKTTGVNASKQNSNAIVIISSIIDGSRSQRRGDSGSRTLRREIPLAT